MRACFPSSRFQLLALILPPLAATSLWAAEAGAGFSDWHIKNWSVDDGFPGSSVFQISQTSDGYLWLSTRDRFVRFDGVRFVSIGPDDRRVMPLPGRRHQRLWCRDSRGELLLRDGHTFRTVPLPPGATGVPQAASDGADGTTWILVGVDTYAWRDGQWTRLTEAAAGLPAITPWLRDTAADRVWCSVSNRLGYIEAGKFFHVWAPPDAADGRLEALVPRRGGGVWVVMRLPNEEVNLLGFLNSGAPPRSMPIPWKGGVFLTDLMVDQRGDFWIASSSHGALRLRPDGTWEAFDARRGLGTAHVRTLFEDLEGNMWIPTDGAGVFRLTPRAFRTYGASDGLTTENVYAVAPSRDGGAWIGTHGNRSEGLFRWRDGRIAFQPGMGPYAWSVHEDPAGDVWAGNFESGLFRLHQGVPLGLVPNSLANVFAICDDGGGGLWIGGLGLSRVRDGRAETAGFPADAKISSLARDASGTLWIGTVGQGLWALREGAFSQFNSAAGLRSDGVLCLYVDAQDVLWIGTTRGLNRRRDGRLASLTSAQGLASDIVSGLAEDLLGNFWVNSSEGIFRVSRKALDDFFDGRTQRVFSVSYSREDGLVTRASTTGSQPRVCRDREGRMWFATLKGAAVIDPATMPVNTNPPPVVLEEVLINGVLQNSAWPAADLSGGGLRTSPVQIDAAGRLRFPPGSRGIEIHYTANSFTSPEKVRFKYRLAGVHPDWVEAGGQRRAVFDQLAPGAYRFEVIACNNDGVWNEQGAAFAFVVLPFFWQTMWFRATFGAATLLAVALLVRHFATRRLRRRLEIAERDRAIENERTRISRDMHDDMGARLTKIAFFSELLADGATQAEATREQALRVAGMSRDAARALDELIWALDPANDYLPNLAHFIARSASELLSQTPLRLRLDLPAQIPMVQIFSTTRRQLVYVVNESLANILKHAQATQVTLTLKIDASRIRLTIQDDGRGLRSSKTREGGGHGLANMRHRIESLGGEMKIESEAARGTRLEFTFPLERPDTRV